MVTDCCRRCFAIEVAKHLLSFESADALKGPKPPNSGVAPANQTKERSVHEWFAAAQLLVQMTSALQTSQCCSAVATAQHSENCSATSVFACGMLQGWGLEGWGLGLADPRVPRMAFSLRERFSWSWGGPQASDISKSLVGSACPSSFTSFSCFVLSLC